MSEWRDIATDPLPKDGTWFWVQRRPTRGRGVNVSAYRWDRHHGAWFAGTGWWYDIEQFYSHWHPMPNEPEALIPNYPAPAPPQAVKDAPVKVERPWWKLW